MNMTCIHTDLLKRAGRLSYLAYQLAGCDGASCDRCGALSECRKVSGSRNLTLVMCSSIIDQLTDAIMKADADNALIHSYWEKTESPYAEIEEGLDGESHPRYTCNHCGGEAGFGCDPEGFASDQDLTPYCPHCHAVMDYRPSEGAEE